MNHRIVFSGLLFGLLTSACSADTEVLDGTQSPIVLGSSSDRLVETAKYVSSGFGNLASLTVLGQVVMYTSDAVGGYADNQGLSGKAFLSAASADWLIDTVGEKSHGVFIRSTSLTDSEVEGVIGDKVSIKVDGDDAEGFYGLVRGNGNVSLTSSATIVTSGVNSDGIVGYVRGGGHSNVQVTGGHLTVDGEDSDGVVAQVLLNGSVNVDAQDTHIITTGSKNSSGIVALMQGFSSENQGQVSFQRGSIQTEGLNSDGIFAGGLAGDYSVSVQDGSIVTTGSGSAGISALSNMGDVTVSQSDDFAISSSGLNSFGVVAAVGDVGQYDLDLAGVVTGGTGLASAVSVAGLEGGFIDLANTAKLSAGSGVAVFADGGPLVMHSLGEVEGHIITDNAHDSIFLEEGFIHGNASLNDGDDNFNWLLGGYTGSIKGGLGSDKIQVSYGQADLSEVIFDGGDDVSVDDTYIDSLVLQGLSSQAFTGSQALNFETIIMENSNLHLSGNFISGVGQDYGLRILNSQVSLADSTSFAGTVLNQGSLDLLGQVHFLDDYIGEGSMIFNLDIAGESGSFAIIDGEVSGVTDLVIQGNNDRGGLYKVPLIRAQQSSLGDFVLPEDYYNSGAQLFELMKDDAGSWFLVNARSSDGRVLVDNDIPRLAALSSAANFAFASQSQVLHQRLGEIRTWLDEETGPIDVKKVTPWVRYDYQSMRSDVASGFEFDQSLSQLNFGADLLVDCSEDFKNSTIIGLYLNTAGGDLSTSGSGELYSALGGTNLDYSSFGYGAYATFSLGKTYLDLKLEGNDFDYEDGSLFQASGTTFGAALEAGYSWEPWDSDEWRLEPQAQLAWSNSVIEDTQGLGVQGLEINQDNYSSFIGRLGLRLEYEGDDFRPYGLLHYIHEFDGVSSVEVNKAAYDVDFGGGRFQLGLGCIADLSDDINLYADARYQAGSKLNLFQANLGLRASF